MRYLKTFQVHGGDFMSSIRNITKSSPVPDDLAKRLGPNGVNEILMVLWQGYYDLISDANIVVKNNAEEDDITLEWYGKISNRWNSQNRATQLKINLIPVHQYPDPTLRKKRGYKPTIDFCFRDWDTSNSYFGAECKNLYEGKNEKIKRYVETGVKNYTSGRYGSQSSESAIVGYILSGELSDIVYRIANTMAATVSPLSNLSREMRYVDPQYLSRHLRTLDNSEIILHHLFFDFT